MRILLDGHKNKRQVHIVLSPHLSTKSVDNSVDILKKQTNKLTILENL